MSPRRRFREEESQNLAGFRKGQLIRNAYVRQRMTSCGLLIWARHNHLKPCQIQRALAQRMSQGSLPLGSDIPSSNNGSPGQTLGETVQAFGVQTIRISLDELVHARKRQSAARSGD